MKFGFIAGKAQKSFVCLADRAQQRGHTVEHIPMRDLPVSYDGICAFVEDCMNSYDALHYYAGLADSIGFFFGKACEEKGMPLLNNRIHISGLVHDKMFQALSFSSKNLPIPRSEFTRSPNWEKLSLKLGAPLIAKKVRGTHGVHVHKITNQHDLDQIKQPSSYIFQEFLPHANDVRVLVLRGKAVCGYQRVPAEGDFRANLALGGYARQLTDEQEKQAVFKLAELAAAEISLDLAGVDLIKKADGDYCLIEININPSWYGITDLTDIQFEEVLLDEYERMSSLRQ